MLGDTSAPCGSAQRGAVLACAWPARVIASTAARTIRAMTASAFRAMAGILARQTGVTGRRDDARSVEWATLRGRPAEIVDQAA